MPIAEKYQNVIIGSGEGGKYLAWHLAQSGQKTAVVERRWIGGSCPNINCLPSKNEIWSAKVANLVYHAGKYGSTATAGPVNMEVVRRRKREMVSSEVQAHLNRYKATGAELILGRAKITGAHTIDVQLNDGGDQPLQAERLFLNLGTQALIPAVPGFAEAGPLTHIELLELDRVPEHLAIVAGGYVGLEFAQAFRRFGSRVTVLEAQAQILPNEDQDVSEALSQIFAEEGIEVVTSARITQVQGRSGESVRVVMRTPSGERTIDASDLAAAAGRVPNTSGIGLELAGVKLDENGFIRVNERLEAAPNVWAIGECAGSPQFTHVSLDDYRVIRDNLAGGKRSTRDRLIPTCLFTDPQVAHVGLREKEAAQRGIGYRLAKIPTGMVLRTHATGESEGFMKALIGADDRILGFTMIGPEAGEVMSVVETAMLAGFPYSFFRDAILAHPTMAEGLNVLFSSVKSAQAKSAA
jgi:pyruvate/2-oxoglutarate dehydrogenase complex dihydrolipoamide dehydrogenase (E3) component